MIGTLFSLVLAVLLWFNSSPHETTLGTVTRGVMGLTALLFLILMFLGFMFAWLPLQKAEQYSTPRILEMFRRDKSMMLAVSWLIAFSLTTIILVSDTLYVSMSHRAWFFPTWIVLLGLSIHAMGNCIKRVFDYLNPFTMIKMFTRQATVSIRQNKELDLCNWMDALSEVAIKGIQKHSTSVCHEAISAEQEIVKLFLLASKSIAHSSQDAQTKLLGIQDKVSYTLFYLYQRLEIIFDKAIKNYLEPTCRLLIVLFGKISVDAAKCDVSLASAPLRFIGKFAKRAQDQGFEESVIAASCVFLEVVREMIAEINLTYYEIKDPFLSIINSMEVLSKEAFKRDKTLSIALLMQPFKDLRTLCEDEKVKNHQDMPIILQNIDRILGEYEALLIVMNTMPPIPSIPNE